MRRGVPRERLHGLESAGRSLTVAEAHGRRQTFGPNEVLEVAGNPWLDLVRETASDPMIWFLTATAVLYAFLGERSEAVTLTASIVPLVALDGYLHRRTRASTEGLKSRIAARALVVRDGVGVDLPAREVVPGDLVVVGTGEFFPADGIVVEGGDAQVDESSLTGESLPARKVPLDRWPTGDGAPPIEEGHWGLAGTRLLTGRVRLRVVFTGPETLYGEIVRSARRGAHARTPLQQGISALVNLLLAAAAALCVILAFVRLRQGYGWIDAIVSAATLAVAALPEEFPVAFTVFLGVGVYRLAKHQALVRRAVSVENIGRVSCICSDKTGTITEGRLRLAHLVTAPGCRERDLLGWSGVASRRESTDPLDEALLDAAEERGVARTDLLRFATYPFTEERRRETAVVGTPGGRTTAASKGSPETILSLTALAPSERSAWEARAAALAAEGHRVIACARRDLDRGWAGGEPDREFRFLGLLALEDPVRAGVPEAIGRCREAGIHVLLVTGDHPSTARAVAREIGLGGGEPSLVLGGEIERRLSHPSPASLRTVDVVARALPSEKLTLVRALQAEGEIVALTGDGVNDVPALQAADIGVAMGERGTRSAREVASIVLLDDNFRSIVRAIAEGRQLFRNLQLAFQYLLLIHIPLVLTATLIPLAGYPLLYLPIHVVWLEAVIHPTALLVFQDLPSGDRLERVRGGRAVRFFTPRQWAVTAAIGLLLAVEIAAGYVWSLGPNGDVPHARAMALVALTFASAAITSILSLLKTRVSRVVVAATLALTILLVQTPALARLLDLRPLHPDDWAVAILGGLAAVLLPLGIDKIDGGGRTAAPPPRGPPRGA